MQNQKFKTDAIESALNAAQGVFSANPAFRAPQADHAWQMQEQILAEFEKFSEGWFQRRQDAVRDLIESGRRVASKGRIDPAVAMTALAEWQGGAMRRLAEDAKACNAMLSRCGGAIIAPDGAAAERSTDIPRKATASSPATLV